MLDIRLVRESPELIKKDLQKRDRPDLLKKLGELKQLDSKWREALQKSEQLRKDRNIYSKEISELKKQKKDASKKLKLAKNIPNKIKAIEELADSYKKDMNKILFTLPNILHKSVPVGFDDTQNKTVRTVGKKPKIGFKPRSHVDIIKEYGLADMKRAAKISGARWYFLTGDLVVLDMALQQYALDFMIKKGYIPVYPPLAIKKEPYTGVTDLGDFEDVMYKVEDEDLYMIATSEHPMIARYQNETLPEKSLPLKFVGVSPCFRKEAGSHGKDTKGIFRVHQFNKVEQIIISDENSWDYHEELLKNSEELIESLGLHFKTVNVCTGDIGTIAAKKYDIDVWMPVQKTYREVTSCSNCTDYQTRRLGLKYKTKHGNKYCHTLNSTAIATSRIIVAIIENFQDKKGNIHIPKVLHKYTNGLKVIKKK
ncbi:serine--tRNA ligase [Candidatus Woesearchaeota archaeon]|nr:serine--tRNA ligase [Candidatus Woesearchaeota archaeon]